MSFKDHFSDNFIAMFNSEWALFLIQHETKTVASVRSIWGWFVWFLEETKLELLYREENFKSHVQNKCEMPVEWTSFLNLNFGLNIFFRWDL